MCLVFAAYKYLPGYRLVIVANRDEFHSRASASAAPWDDAHGIIAGRDLEAGGTWLGVTRAGRFSALTNFREASAVQANPPSRGALVADFLRTACPTDEYLSTMQRDSARYNGFNLLVDDGDSLGYCSNRDRTFKSLDPGLYGLSNHLLDTPWPKVTSGKRRLAQLFARGELPSHAELFGVIADIEIPAQDLLPNTGVSPEYQRVLSPAFIRSPGYGTRATTLVGFRYDGSGFLLERSYDAHGRASVTVEHKF